MRELLIKVIEELGFVKACHIGGSIYEYDGDSNSHKWVSIKINQIYLHNCGHLEKKTILCRKRTCIFNKRNIRIL